MRSRLVAVFIGLAVGLAARPGAATVVRIVNAAHGEPLVAGQLVRLSWDRLPDDVEEMELLLDMHAGAPQHIRLTAQLAGATQTYLWRVPNLPATEATLRLRWGRDGVETECEPSAPFTILRDPKSPVDGVRFHRGELWIHRPAASFEPSCDDRGRITEAGADHALTGAVSVVTEVSPDETKGRHRVSPSRGHRPRCAGDLDPAVAARHPLTIPLRT